MDSEKSQLDLFASLKIYDLSTTLSPDTTTFPGDDPFSSEITSSLNLGHVCNLRKISCSNHLGTHIDYPLHLFSNGKSSSDYKLDQLRGIGIIVDVPDKMKSITKQFIQKIEINEQDIVFFKTANSKISKTGLFNPDFTFIEPEAAELIALKKPKMIGIDYLSVDSYEAHDLPTHKILLSKQILLVEGLELKEVPSGRCFIHVIPINVANMDGIPTRVFCHF